MDSNYREGYSSVSNPEDNGHAQSITSLETKVKALSAQLKALADNSDMEEFLVIIRRPGFTTIAELALLSGTVDSIQGHVDNLTKMRKTLLSGSRAINNKPAEATSES
jgi:hypothetical protein